MPKKENTFIGVFNSEEEVLNKVTELKAQGHNESDMYVVGRDHNSFSGVHNQTDVHVDATNEKKSQGFLGKFMAALSGDSSLAAFRGMGLERYEEKEYYQQVQNGKLVLYADRDYGDTYNQYQADYSNSAGVNQTSPIESGATFASSGSAGSAADADNIVDASSKNKFASNADLSESIREKSGGRYNSLEDADSDFGKSITADGNMLDSASGTNSVPFSSASQNNRTSGQTSETTNSSSEAISHSHDSTLDSGGTYGSTSGTSGYTEAGSHTDDEALGAASGMTDEERLLLHEEHLNVEKERVQTGEVNVGKHVVEEKQSIDVPVEREEVYVERRPVNDETADTDAFQENDTIHVPVSEERVNVSKKDVVSEETVISKRKIQDTEQVNETLRREVADIDEDTNDLNSQNSSLNNKNNNKRE